MSFIRQLWKRERAKLADFVPDVTSAGPTPYMSPNENNFSNDCCFAGSLEKRKSDTGRRIVMLFFPHSECSPRLKTAFAFDRHEKKSYTYVESPTAKGETVRASGACPPRVGPSPSNL